MDEYDVKRLGLILSIQAVIDGMKAENMQREINGQSMAYRDYDFFSKADELQNAVYRHREQL